MTGADIVGAVLQSDPAVTAVVPAGSIRAGRLAESATLPALLVRVVSTVERQTLARGETRRRVDRVAVTARTASYREQKAIMRLVRSCCADRTGDIGGGSSVSLLLAGTGPDVDGPGNSFERTQDVRCSFEEPA